MEKLPEKDTQCGQNNYIQSVNVNNLIINDDTTNSKKKSDRDVDHQEENNKLFLRSSKNDEEKKDFKSEIEDISYNSYIDMMPDEVLLFIFSFFNINELCNKVAPVCRRWNKLANDPSLWLTLNLSVETHSIEKVIHLIEKSPFLMNLKISSSENGSVLLKAIAKNCRRLKELSIRFCDGLTKDMIEGIVENLSKLEVMIVEGTTIHSPDCYPLLGKLKYLRHLDLSYSKFLEDNGLISIAEQCSHLQYLNIDYISYISDVSVKRLIELRGSSLTHLYLDGEQMTDRGFCALSACVNLEHLGISFCEEMTDIGLSSVRGLSNLQWLRLRKGVRLTPQGLRDIFINGKLSKLTHINLSECTELDDSVLISLSQKCLNITHLCLHWCWEVTDVGMTELVKNCSHLLVLDLTGMVRITGTPFRSLNSQLPHLTVLNLEQCNSIDDEILQELFANRPSLKVIDYYGDCFIPLIKDGQKT